MMLCFHQKALASHPGTWPPAFSSLRKARVKKNTEMCAVQLKGVRLFPAVSFMAVLLLITKSSFPEDVLVEAK